MSMSRTLLSSLFAATFAASALYDTAQSTPQEKTIGKLETVAQFRGPMPTGVTVSHKGRIFVNFPRWGDKVDFTVAEVKNGQAVAFPNSQMNRPDTKDAANHFISVQSVVASPDDRLWILDTGSILMKPVVPNGPKLIGYDLKTNRMVKKIVFPPNVALPTTYLNDVRFDLKRGKEGTAFITDSAEKGPNGIIVVDLASGRSWRRLNDHYSTKAEQGFVPFVEGQALFVREPGKAPEHLKMGSDGIAISADGKSLYYCALSSRRLYRVSTDALADESKTDAQVQETVESLGDKGASDGLETDAQNRIYITNYETNTIVRRGEDGQFETVVHDPRVLWPDTMSIASDGYLYFTANQLHRQPRYHNGKDMRQKPYSLFRVKIDSGPILRTAGR